MKIEIDIDELIEEAVKHMEDEDDVRWSVGMALQVLYEDKWLEVQERLNQLYLERVKENTFS
jgi:tRNA U54 and U55 pseudouridine synthase Pus10